MKTQNYEIPNKFRNEKRETTLGILNKQLTRIRLSFHPAAPNSGFAQRGVLWF
jgi:hypothetical protein